MTEEPQTESDEEKTDAENAEESDVEPDGNPADPGEVVEEPETHSETERQPETVAQTALLAEGVASQTDAIASGEGWVLDADGKLTIQSDAGMTNWCSLRDSKTLTHPNQDSVETVVIQTGVTGIADKAFFDCKNLSAIEIPDSVTSIGIRAFQGSGLEDITIPAGVTRIETGLFLECKQLQRITLPDILTEIGDNAFYTCSSLREITIPAGVTEIGIDAFSGCSSLREITIPSGVTSIADAVFSRCSSLGEITIPSGVTSIGSSAFSDCSSLKEITIPSGVTKIGYSLFSGCSNLETVTMLSRNPVSLEYEEFEGCKFVTDNTKGIKVPAGTAETYKTAWTDWADYITDGTEDLIASGTGWTLDSSGKLTIQSDAGMADWTAKCYDSIDLRQAVKSVAIQDGVSYIQRLAFYYCHATEVTIADSVTKIEDGAFKNCEDLKEIRIPASVKSIGDEVFFACKSLEKIEIPDDMTTIGDRMFSNCSSLTSIQIPASVTEIKEDAFSGCSSLSNIEIPDNVTIIGRGAFRKCNGLKNIRLPDGVTAIADHMFEGCSGLTSLELPMGVTALGEYAFAGCSSLTNIEIPDGVTSIGMCVFMNCSGLTDIKIPADLTTIVDSMFAGCSGLTKIEIPAGVTVIEESAFAGCSGLTNIKIPDGVTSIGMCAFMECSGLTDIKIPDGVTSIEPGLFVMCSGLEQITIPSGVTVIGAEAFEVCSGLTSIVIPSGVTDIGPMAFYGCSGLERVTMQGNEPPTLGGCIEETGETYVFAECKFVTDAAQGIKVPEGTVDAYKAAWTEWADYITETSESEGSIIASGEGWKLDSSGKLTIQSDTGMSEWDRSGRSTCAGKVISVEIEMNTESPITSISKDAFLDCINMTSMTMPDSVVSIAGFAFMNFDKLTDVKLSNNLKSIEEYTFYGCSKLTDITIPNSVTEIGRFAFYGCSDLTNITIPDSVTGMGGYVFNGCSSLTGVTIPFGMASIEEGMFRGCNSLTGISIPSSVTSIGAWAFCDCSGLTSISLPSGVTDIKYGAFQGCSSMTSIVIPDRVTDIGHWAFKGCSSLKSVTMQGNEPPTLGALDGENQIFDSCKFVTENTKGIKVPEGTVDAYKTAWPDWADYIAGGSAATSDKEKVDAAKKAVEDALAGIHVSNATTKESLEAEIREAVKKALEAAGISGDVDISVENFTRTDATTEATGDIRADIKITSGAETVEVPVEKTIDRLPGTPADKVAAVRTSLEEAVKRAIDEALAGTKVTNDNAQEIAGQISALIPEAVAGALEAAGVGADEVEIGEVGIKIEPATADGEGSINVTIPVTSREDAGAADSAVIRVPVTKPGEEENPDKEVEEAQKAVEDALKDITVTNETTKEDILEELQKELGDKAKIEGIEKFEKEEATEEKPGQISLSIKITINGKTVIINVTVAIPQLSKKTGVYVRFTDYYDMDGSIPRYKYTGSAVKPAVEVYNNETRLTLGKDYTIGYKNNTKAGSTASLTVKGKGSFSGASNAVNFTIINADIDQDTEHPTEMTVTVNTKVSPVIMNGTRKLTTKDYVLEGDGLKNGKYMAATAESTPNTLTVKGINNYAGSSFAIKVTVIEKKAAGKLSVNVDKNFKPVYNGSTLDLSALFTKTQDEEGAITVTDAKDKAKILKEGIDFTVVCTSNLVNAGTVKFTLTGMGAYTGSVSKTFKISPLKVTDRERFSVTFDENRAYEYDASGVAVDNLVVRYLGETDADTDDKILIQGVDYKVSYTNNKKVSGTKDASLKITFLGNYKGSSAVTRTFKVVTAKLSAGNTIVTVSDKVYSKANGAYKSTPIVTVDGLAIKASNYTVSYAWATESEAGDDTKYLADNKVKITIADGDTWAKVKVTVTPKETGSYALAEGAVLMGEYYVRKADNATNLSKAKVTFYNKEGTQLKTLEYNGYPFYTPAGNNPDTDSAPEDPNAVYVRVTVSGAVVNPDLYEVIWTNATAKGKATVVIRGKGSVSETGIAVGSKNQAISIKAMALKGKTLKSFMENAMNAANSLRNMFF